MASTGADLNVTVKLFATLRDRAPHGAGVRGFGVSVPRGATVGDLAEQLELPKGAWRVAFRNHRHCGAGEALQEGDVVAFVPPIAGG